jgi:hypothetical protein
MHGGQGDARGPPHLADARPADAALAEEARGRFEHALTRGLRIGSSGPPHDGESID